MGGRPHAEFGHQDWVRPEAERLSGLYLVAHELLDEAELASGRGPEVIPALESSVRSHPLRESFVAQLMLGLHRSGRQADAPRCHRTHEQVPFEVPAGVDRIDVEATRSVTEAETGVGLFGPAGRRPPVARLPRHHARETEEHAGPSSTSRRTWRTTA